MVRILRFLFIAAGAFLGFYGIAITLTVSIAYASVITSFGVPFFSPLAPHYKSSKDMITRSPLWKQIFRPSNIKPQDKVRKHPLKRGDSSGK
jgi:spore germination protein KA